MPQPDGKKIAVEGRGLWPGENVRTPVVKRGSWGPSPCINLT